MRLPWQRQEFARTCDECGCTWHVPRLAARRRVRSISAFLVAPNARSIDRRELARQVQSISQEVSCAPVTAVLASLPGTVGYLAAGLPAGVLVDRLDPWRVLIAGDVTRAAIFLALFMLTGPRAAAAWLILTLAFAAGAVTVFSDTALVTRSATGS